LTKEHKNNWKDCIGKYMALANHITNNELYLWLVRGCTTKSKGIKSIINTPYVWAMWYVQVLGFDILSEV
jgi:hypothetical protein